MIFVVQHAETSGRTYIDVTAICSVDKGAVYNLPKADNILSKVTRSAHHK